MKRCSKNKYKPIINNFSPSLEPACSSKYTLYIMLEVCVLVYVLFVLQTWTTPLLSCINYYKQVDK